MLEFESRKLVLLVLFLAEEILNSEMLTQEYLGFSMIGREDSL